MSGLAFILGLMLAAATPFLLAAVGELVVERSGVLNLGIEGMMAIAAAVAFGTVHSGYGHAAGFAVGALAGAATALVFGVLALEFRANQVAAGLAVGLLGEGLSSLVGKPWESLTTTALPKLAIPGLSQLPVIGGMFRQDIVVWGAFALAAAIGFTLNRTRLGLMIRAVGEDPHAARALGIRVTALRYGCVLFGGAMAGLAGAYASTCYTPLWAEGMIAGRGWIAVALVVFGTWITGRVVAGAVLFGALSLTELAAQAMGAQLPSQVLSSLPYVATIVALGVISSNRRLLARNGIASLGKPF